MLLLAQLLSVTLSLRIVASSAFPTLQNIVADGPEPKYAVAHFMVGNTYPYTVADWNRDITLAASKGLDAFVLNIGRDSWQPERVADAFRAVATHNFKLFLSFDMTSIPCGSRNDIELFGVYLRAHAVHPNYLYYRGRPLISTFSGEHCTFGEPDMRAGWRRLLNFDLPPVYFVPSFFVDPGELQSLDFLDGAFNWNSAWPMGNYNANFDADRAYISNLGGRTYMAGVSPWFFTHYGPDTYNKNFIYKSDRWLFASKWELIIENRASVDIAQVITWNDYGESHYVGPIAGAQPNSEAWTNGYDHQGWLDLMEYYVVAFKTGYYPTVTRDSIILWSRLYPTDAMAPDYVGRPRNAEWSEDSLWAVIFLTSPANVKIACGPSSLAQDLPSAGLWKMTIPLVPTCDVTATIWRGGNVVLQFAPRGFTFRSNPPNYNFNAFVASATASGPTAVAVARPAVARPALVGLL